MLLRNSLNKVKVITPEGEIKDLTKKECQLGTRGSMLKEKKYLVVEATFNLIKDDKIIIQKTMSVLAKDIHVNQCIFQVLDVSLFGTSLNTEVYIKNIKKIISLAIKLEMQ